MTRYLFSIFQALALVSGLLFSSAAYASELSSFGFCHSLEAALNQGVNPAANPNQWQQFVQSTVLSEKTLPTYTSAPPMGACVLEFQFLLDEVRLVWQAKRALSDKVAIPPVPSEVALSLSPSKIEVGSLELSVPLAAPAEVDPMAFSAAERKQNYEAIFEKVVEQLRQQVLSRTLEMPTTAK